MKCCPVIRTAVICLLCGSLLFASGCSEMVSRSIKTGVFSYVTGSVNDTFQSRQFNSFLNDLLTGGGLRGGSGPLF
jgi:hypothetical protein